jgi:hypothetical protein
MKKYYFILFFLGIFCFSNSTYACGKSSEKKIEKHSCKKETSSQSSKHCCCDNDNKAKKHNGCGGKCGHSNCIAPTISFSSILTEEFEFNLNGFYFSVERQKFYISETNTSNGFYLMWFIPKIS